MSGNSQINEIKKKLQLYLSREKRLSLTPLQPLSTNLPTDLRTKTSSVSSVALDLVDSFCASKQTKSVENLSLAFKCLYSSAKSHDDRISLVKKHQHYVVFLNSQMRYKYALGELCTIYNVFTSSLLSTSVAYETLLKGVSHDVGFPLTLIISFHFFLIQSVLQMLTSKVQTITKKDSSLDIKLFWKTASLFLLGSNFDTCLSFCDTSVAMKYHLNCLKMLSGLVKVAEFINSKLPTLELSLSIIALKLKVLQYNVLTNNNVDLELCDINDIALKPFVSDLHIIISKDQRFMHSKVAAKVAEFYLQDDSARKLVAPQSLLNLSLLAAEAMSISSLDSLNKKSVLNFFEQTEVCIQSASVIKPILESVPAKAMTDFHHDILDRCVLYLKSALVNDQVFSHCLKEWAPIVSCMLIQEKRIENIKLVSRLCFEFALKSELLDGFFTACQLDLAYFHLLKKCDSKVYVSKRIEYSISSLFDLGAEKSATQLVKEYIQDDTPRLTENRVLSIIASCLIADQKMTHHFFGKTLFIAPDEQIRLFENLLIPLHLKLPIKNHGLLKDLMENLPKTVLLATRYKVSQYFQIEVYISRVETLSLCPDVILAAGIFANRSKINKLDTLALKKIDAWVHQWLDHAHMSKFLCHFSVFLEILTILSHMGFFNRCIKLIQKLIERLKGSNFKETQGLINLNILLSRCLLEISEIDKLPHILQNYGSLLKDAFSGKISDYGNLVNLKLTQLEFFIKIRDEEKSRSKFEELKSIISSRPEYDLLTTVESQSLHDKLSCFLTIAKFLFLTSMMNIMSAEMFTALRNLKLSIKLLLSVLRKTESNPELYRAKLEALSLLSKSYIFAFKAAKHLGLTKDAMHFCLEFVKINSQLHDSPLKTLNHFISSNLLLHVGKTSDAISQFDNGRRNTWESPYLDLAEAIVFTRLNVGCIPKKCLQRTIHKALACLFETPEKVDHFCASFLFISDLLVDLGSLTVDLDSMHLSKLQQDSPDTHETLTRAILLLREILTQVESIGSESGKLITLVQLFPCPTSSSKIELRPANKCISRVLDCRETLKHFADKDFLRRIEVGEMRDLCSLLRRCVFLLSSSGHCQDSEMMILLQKSFMCGDLSQSLPYFNQRAAIHENLSESVLLPTLHATDNLNFAKITTTSFYKDFQKLLPASWAVVTLDVCDVSGDLIISRLDTKADDIRSLKLPFNRRTRGTGPGFEEYLKELNGIISESNNSTKNKVTSTIRTKDERKLWWKIRFELDSQLQMLLQQMEQLTIGGFTGMFNTFDSTAREYESFQLELNKIWTVAIGDQSISFGLDQIFVELFYHVCLYERHENSYYEYLKDLTDYAIHHYDLDTRVNSEEAIDKSWLIDSISKIFPSIPDSSSFQHLVIIPSPSCVHIPWESMSFLRGRSVSRMPSVGVLTESLKNYKRMSVFDKGDEKILYVINPGSDLGRTQKIFEPVFHQLLCAKGIAGESPSEEWLASELFDTNLYVYLGHGGGEQYLRSSALFKSNAKGKTHLPASLLMGCSSSAFHGHGNLPSSSNVFNWLVCGSPAIVTNLWDITDKDIDVFSLSMFAEWGLGEGYTQSPKSIAHAMTKSRDACILKYLNGAAPILHGLPLTLK
ncbi:hypothetical protein METBIDRAFT_30325 [Metschnikowia bicuspidata var. bicuspidata NRRL YB-4993]|uniref:separase n=1 Tax=Metschnikowia bicuspidata var. bicuspidata NRRL YB-4993 TaxID=869754 RepID=A0A1A0HIX4_9ASCO|nr:hypothetical protein METBIDRAFT_30325 [Metschnikowia bicuspidata var. bicuspidata NRRL YB-4993]OBA23965.1 hypothetical protein METBIDRAFT_30325 [Metschnikowia bicuspidata var. bicuspidata NRRL YB-4993]